MSALAVALGAQARAGDSQTHSAKVEDPARTGKPGGAERTPAVGETAGATRELSGTFVKADAKTVYLEHMGAIVPLKIDESTRFSGEGVKSSRDLTEGQEVRATFTVKETTNVARRISAETGSSHPPETHGGAMPPGHPEGMPPGHPGVPPEPGPGVPSEPIPVPRDPGTPGPSEPGIPPGPKY